MTAAESDLIPLSMGAAEMDLYWVACAELELKKGDQKAARVAMNGASPSSQVWMAPTTFAQVIQALTARLARDGIQVSPNADTVFRMKFAESAGDQLPIFERQSPFDFRGRDTGRTVTEATGSHMVELHVPGHDGPIWRDSLDATLGLDISDLNFPYFIPQSPELLALPVVID